MKHNWLSWMILVLLTLGGCSMLTSPEPQLEPLAPADISQMNWKDDQDFANLERAVAQSLRYYRRLPNTRTFTYLEETYTTKEMIQSLELFQSILQSYQGKERLTQIQEKFLFFESKNEHGRGFFTGYYEPMLEGSLEPTEEFTVALYEKPSDMITVRLSQFYEDAPSRTLVGRLKGKRLIPYDSRDDIVYQDSLEKRAKPIVYVDEIEQFFLQIQGSGLVRLSDGEILRVNYAASNGHPYRAIGALLLGEIPREKMSLQTLKTYLHNNPDRVKEILNYNPSYTFFRQVEEGPLGNINVPLTPKRSIAMDSRKIPRGGLAFFITEEPMITTDSETPQWKPVQQFAVVQDTGGAIRDHGRVDIFWGNGPEAELSAGYMQRPGRIFLLVAKKEFLQPTWNLVETTLTP